MLILLAVQYKCGDNLHNLIDCTTIVAIAMRSSLFVDLSFFFTLPQKWLLLAPIDTAQSIGI